VINVVGFAGAVGQTVPIGATYIYRLNFFAGFIVASLTYIILNKIWPAKAVPEQWTEDGDQNILEGRVGRVRSDDDYEQGMWKANDGLNKSDFNDTKLKTSDSPTGSNF
jgi:nucleobase:cation symporter-1, NCS1 family